jgi:hypothetical protein
MPRRAGEAVTARQQGCLNNIGAWVSTAVLKNLCHVDATVKQPSKTTVNQTVMFLTQMQMEGRS